MPRKAAHLGFGFPRAERSGRVVIEAEGVDVAVPGRTLVADVGFTLERGQRLALVGPNGAGKTTLVETLIGRRAPSAAASPWATASRSPTSQHGAGLRDGQRPETVLAAGDLTQPRRARCSAASCSPARPPTRRWSGCRAASGAAWSSSR